MKKNILAVVVCLITILVVFFFKNNTKIVNDIERINYINYNNLEELEEASNLIIIAMTNESLKEREKMKESDKEWTQTKLKVSKILKGEEKEISELETMKLKELFSYKKGEIVAIEQYVPLEKNKKYILFLSKEKEDGVYSLVNVNNGRYNIEEKEDIKRKNHTKIEKEIMQKYEKEINN